MSTAGSGGLVAMARVLFAVETGQMTHELSEAERRVRSSSHNMERDMGAISRGAIAGSGAFRELGRSVAFASLSFIGAYGFERAIETSVHAADELHDQVERVSAVFKSSAQDVLDWGKSSATAMGLSSAAAYDAASTIGTLLQNVGATPAEAAKMSKSLVQLAADMAAFKKGGATTSDALGALESALAGRTRGLKAYGIVISNTTLKQEALRLGLLRSSKDSVADLTNGQRALATYAAIMAQTNEMQGAFARNSGDLSVKLAIFHAAVTNLEAALGEALVPALEGVVDSANKWLTSGDNAERMQHRLESAARDVAKAMHDLGVIIHDVDKITGSFENTLITVGLLAASWKAAGLIAALTTVGTEGRAAATAVELLKTRLAALPALTVLTIELITIKKAIDAGAAHHASLRDLGISAATDKGGDLEPVWNGKQWVDRNTGAPIKDQAYWNSQYPNVKQRPHYDVKGAYENGGTPKVVKAPEHDGATAVGGKTNGLADSKDGKSGLRGKGPSGNAPKPGDVTSTPYLDYELANAGETATRSDDERLLAQKIRVLKARKAAAKTLANKTALQQAIDDLTSQLTSDREQDANEIKSARQDAKDKADRIAAARKTALEKAKQIHEATVSAIAAAEQGAGEIPIHLQLLYARAQDTKTTRDDVLRLHQEETVLKQRLRTGTVSYTDGSGHTRTARLDDAGRLAIQQQLNGIHDTLRQIADNTAPLLTIRQRQGFIESLSGILGEFASDTATTTGGGKPRSVTVHVDNRGQDASQWAVARAAREAANHILI